MKYLIAFLLMSCASQAPKVPTEATAPGPGFRVLTLDNMDDYQGSILDYVMDAPKLKKSLNSSLQMHRNLCKQGHGFSCEAMDQLKAQRDELPQGLIDITWVKGCSTHALIKERKGLTGKADPRLMKELRIYSEAHKRETGKALDLSKCE